MLELIPSNRTELELVVARAQWTALATGGREVHEPVGIPSEMIRTLGMSHTEESPRSVLGDLREDAARSRRASAEALLSAARWSGRAHPTSTWDPSWRRTAAATRGASSTPACALTKAHRRAESGSPGESDAGRRPDRPVSRQV